MRFRRTLKAHTHTLTLTVLHTHTTLSYAQINHFANRRCQLKNDGTREIKENPSEKRANGNGKERKRKESKRKMIGND